MGNKTGAEKGYSVSTLARLMGVDRRTLASRLQDATPVKQSAREKLYRLSDAIQGFISQPLQGAEASELQEARGRKLEAEAGLAELRLGKERGELVSHRDVVDDYLLVFRSLHVQLTQTMPSQLAPALYQAKSPTRVAELLRAETERIMAYLKREMADYLAAKDKAEGVVDAEDGDGDGA